MRSTTLNRLSLWEDNSMLSYIAARAQRTMLSPSPFTLLSCNTNTNQDADSLTRSILAEDYYVADTPATYRVLKHYRCRQQSREQRAVSSLCWRCLPLSSIQTQQKSILSFCVLNIQQSSRLWHYGKDHEGKLDDSNNEADGKSSPRSEQLLHISQSRFGMVFLHKKKPTPKRLNEWRTHHSSGQLATTVSRNADFFCFSHYAHIVTLKVSALQLL